MAVRPDTGGDGTLGRGGEGSIVCEMQRVGDDLVMATDWGVMVWDGARMRRFAVDHEGELREGR